MRIKGLHDINTHRSLDRSDQLVGVAKNMRKQRSMSQETKSDLNDDVSRHIFKKLTPPRKPAPSITPLYYDPDLIKEYLLTTTRDLLDEMRQAATEGWPVAIAEVERLNKRVKDLEVIKTE